MLRVPAHEATTAALAAAHPFAASRPLPAGGVLIGRDLLGGVFVHDPFELYASGVLTNPNMLVLGQIGRGKSALVKSYLYRQSAFGRRVVVLDPKGEYGPLAAALGCSPVALSPGGGRRVNPLEGAGGDGSARSSTERARRRLALLAALASSCLGRPLRPVEHTALELALERASAAGEPPVLPVVVEALLTPAEEGARRVGMSAALLRSDSRDVALELRRLVHGELRGMFDGPTSPGLVLDGSALVLDLSSVYRSPALGAVMACATAFLESIGAGRARTVLVVDEAWAVLADVGVARYLQSSWKLARARGLANVAVLHRVSDLAAGGAGSTATRLAEGLLADSETIVCYGLPFSEIAAATDALGLAADEAALLARLPRGTALWRVAGRSYLVQHRLSPAERTMVDTDARLVGRRPRR